MRTPVGSRLRASASRRTCLRRLEECRSASTPAWIVSNYQLGSSQVAAGPSSNQPALVQTITDSFASPYLLDQERTVADALDPLVKRLLELGERTEQIIIVDQRKLPVVASAAAANMRADARQAHRSDSPPRRFAAWATYASQQLLLHPHPAMQRRACQRSRGSDRARGDSDGTPLPGVMVKLELGSGDRPTPGFVHLDARPGAPDVDIVCDASRLDECKPAWVNARDEWLNPIKPCDEIRATHLLEHFSHRDTVELLKHWRSYLKPSGRLYLEVPNLTGHIKQWSAGGSSDSELVVYLFGEQDHEFNQHRTMFSEATLRDSLERAGLIVLDVRDLGLVLCAEAMR